jgi:hypothetical protein
MKTNKELVINIKVINHSQQTILVKLFGPRENRIEMEQSGIEFESEPIRYLDLIHISGVLKYYFLGLETNCNDLRLLKVVERDPNGTLCTREYSLQHTIGNFDFTCNYLSEMSFSIFPAETITFNFFVMTYIDNSVSENSGLVRCRNKYDGIVNSEAEEHE